MNKHCVNINFKDVEKSICGIHFLAWLFTKNHISEKTANKLSSKHNVMLDDIFQEFINNSKKEYIAKLKFQLLLKNYITECKVIVNQN